jgi:hypothetical protein
MGGSRRRNVPDQVEQPMMRNEHIVRAHETPIAAVNPVNGRAWRVLHVDDTAAVGGNGTSGSPFRTLAEAQAVATREYDVVFVRPGTGLAAPYAAEWQFQADNQILVGAGSTLELATANCGLEQFFNTGTSGQYPTTTYPVLTSSGTAITLRNGAIVDHLQVADAPVAIAAGPSLTGVANVNDVIVTGTNGPGQVGIQLTNVPGGATVNFYNMQVRNAGRGFWVDGGAADVNFQGGIFQNDSPLESVLVQNATGGTVNINQQLDTLDTPSASNPIVQLQDYGIFDEDSLAAGPINVSLNTNTAVNIGRVQISNPSQRGVAVQANVNSQITFLDLSVVGAVEEAFVTESNDANSGLTIGPTSALSSASTLRPAFASNDDAFLSIELSSLESAVAAGSNQAIVLQGASQGSFEIKDAFTVSGTPGTVAGDVTNTTAGPVIVTVPTP